MSDSRHYPGRRRGPRTNSWWGRRPTTPEVVVSDELIEYVDAMDHDRGVLDYAASALAHKVDALTRHHRRGRRPARELHNRTMQRVGRGMCKEHGMVMIAGIDPGGRDCVYCARCDSVTRESMLAHVCGSHL